MRCYPYPHTVRSFLLIILFNKQHNFPPTSWYYQMQQKDAKFILLESSQEKEKKNNDNNFCDWCDFWEMCKLLHTKILLFIRLLIKDFLCTPKVPMAQNIKK